MMISPQLRHAAAFSLALTTLIAPAAYADDSSNTIKLPQLEVNGSRIAADDAVLPQGAVIIDRTQLDRMPAGNLAEALRSIGGVTISNQSDTITGGQSTVDIGGFGATAGQNTLILLNGRRINTVDLSSVNLSSIPLSAIDHIEVLTGTGSVLYGNGASGGVVNVVTRAQYENGGRIEATLGEHNTHGGSAQGSFNKGNVNGMLSAGKISSDNYRKNNESSQTNLFGDISYQQGSTALALTTLYSKNRVGLPGPLQDKPGGAITAGDWLLSTPYATNEPDNDATDKTLQFLPSARYQINDNLTAYLDTGFRVQEREYNRIDFGSKSDFGNTDRTLNISPRLEGNAVIVLPNRWTVGFDYYRTRYSSFSNSSFGSSKSHFHRSTQAIYGQDSIGLTDNTWLTLGARHEWVRTTASDPSILDGNKHEAGMWNAGIRHNLSDKVSVFTNVERSVRYANVDELGFWETTPLGALASQKTQTGKTYSLGGKWQSDGQYSTITLWQSKYQNEIVYDPNGNGPFGPGVNQNMDPTKRQGVSLNSYWKLQDNLWLATSGTYQEAKFRKGEYKHHNVPLVSRVTGYARIDWMPIEQVTLSLAERYQGKQYMDEDFNNNYGKRIPSYRFMDISATFRPTGKKSVFVTATLHNAENRKGAYDYANASTFLGGAYAAYPLPGRYLIVKAGVDF